MTGTQCYNNDDLTLTVNGIQYDIDVKARAKFYYSRATRFEPEDYEFEIEEINAVWRDGEGNPVEETQEMKNVLENYLNDKAEWKRDFC